VTLRWARKASEAGAADYVAAHNKVFLLMQVEIRRAGSHASYFADSQDFRVQTSRGEVVDAQQFGVTGELKSRHVYHQPVSGIIGFEVPTRDMGLRLLWQPTFDSNPDAQAVWVFGGAAPTVRYQP